MSKHLDNRIEGKIDAKEIILGKGVVVEKDVIIRGKHGTADKVRLGDFSFIGRGSVILTPHFELGDYSKLNAGAFVHGEMPARIGRNCWFGGNVILDSMGGLDIDDNVGIGAHSQVWTHMQFGDLVEGCRFYSNRYMYIGKDVWLVGHCILSPVEVGERSMALVGSVITKNMLPNHIYAGVPAQDVTEKMGNQFEERSSGKKEEVLQKILNEFFEKYPQHKGSLRACLEYPAKLESGVSYFNVSNRTYSQNYSEAEVAFLKAKVPLVKFTPKDSPAWLIPSKIRG
jgi:acetyltransferase-like isoleucine patch superfamily enzyme